MHGLNTRESAQKIIEAMRIHYSFCRVYQTLGMTPSDAAGLKLDLGGNKIEKLIRLGTTRITNH